MLSKHPNLEREEPATSPALARRRDHMLRSDATRHIEPRLIPAAGDEQPAEFDVAEDEPAPDIPPPPPEAKHAANDLGLERSGGSPRGPKLWPMAAAAVSLIALGAGTWLIYERMMVGPSGGDIPYVAADAGPEKIRPQQEGGMEVPNQDIRVYNELDRSPPAGESEVLLPAPEAPVTPPGAADDKSPGDTAGASGASAPEPALDVTPAAGTDTQPDDAAEGSGAPSVGVTMTDEPIQSATTTGAFRIQLAAVKTPEAAQVAWKKMEKTYPEVLKGLALNVVKIDRGAEGALFRVQGGPFADRAAAESACGKLKQRSQACLVVAP